MGAFDDLIKQAMDPNNADKLADIIADINEEYSSLAQFKESQDAKIGELTNNLSEREKQLLEMKSQNYDLTMRLPANKADNPKPEDESGINSIDDLFE